MISVAGIVRADVGGSVRSQLALVENSIEFRNGQVDSGPIAGGLQRWKFATMNGAEQQMFTIDGVGVDEDIVRETYDRITSNDPFSLQQRAVDSERELRRLLSPREYSDFAHAAAIATVNEAPVRLTAHFYRGSFAGYEVLEPSVRSRGTPDRFEWRSFTLSELPHAIALARQCNNGEDCAAWF